jgi:hypothetical protein
VPRQQVVGCFGAEVLAPQKAALATGLLHREAVFLESLAIAIPSLRVKVLQLL